MKYLRYSISQDKKVYFLACWSNNAVHTGIYKADSSQQNQKFYSLDNKLLNSLPSKTKHYKYYRTYVSYPFQGDDVFEVHGENWVGFKTADSGVDDVGSSEVSNSNRVQSEMTDMIFFLSRTWLKFKLHSSHYNVHRTLESFSSQQVYAIGTTHT